MVIKKSAKWYSIEMVLPVLWIAFSIAFAIFAIYRCFQTSILMGIVVTIVFLSGAIFRFSSN